MIRRLNGKCDHLGITLGEVIAERDRLRAEVEAKQARIDALMLEHCPDEMTQEQTDNVGAKAPT